MIPGSCELEESTGAKAAPPAPNGDAYAPAEMARRVEETGVRKANLDVPSMLALAVMAGAFISMGAAFSTVAMTDSKFGYGATKLLGGLAFSLGLILVVVAGAELFTGNNLVVMAWASGRVSTAKLLRNWGWVYLGNLAGALASVGLVYLSRRWEDAGGQTGVTAIRIALAKAALPFGIAFVLGLLCNALVCLAVWLCFSARTTTDKILSILFPITAFVALGFEHSIANMYFIPLGILLKAEPSLVQAGGWSAEALAPLGWEGFVRNLVPVTLGNVVGGGLMVAGIYWFVYQRPKRGNVS
ncbi:MAG: formate/nitrite transporter family protein [Planctomycetes bacterium]|nr:formate/nitrite transporter family protein [Planctomycetota bacterium]